ncbi:hypothetical protein H7992_05100 [Sporosarcina sp. resist]|uniref:MobP2 family relaxase n=1 Tax=Sporosarcina sp. resist TaxID=2762563 RepID=UPI00164E40DD|nr:MobP2 family relaxase [Sporosarcina sp. resist]QNK89103.1 hypothetical protein H7992_05100 [Sporosarcina sp. resist]
MGSTPGVVLKSKFVMPSSKGFNDYVSYIDRDDAKVKQEIVVSRDANATEDFSIFHSYLDYMGDDEKQGALFTRDKNQLNEEGKNEIKKKFEVAKKNGSPMWQDVISFDNAWLEKNGLYIFETRQLDETKLKDIVREAVEEMLKAERMDKSAVWTAAIHYNTDNIHVHIATVEPYPSREKKKVLNKETGQWEEQVRAKRKQGSLDKMKSKVANLIMDRTEERNQTTNLIRGSVAHKKNKGVDLSSYRKTRRLFRKAIDNLPDDRRQWQYGYQSFNEARPHIDQIVEVYLETYYKKEMKELYLLLDDEVQVMKELYGEGSNYKNYQQTKLDDLKKRMGNAVLVEMKVYKKKEDASLFQQSKQGINRNGYSATNRQSRKMQNGEVNSALQNLNYRLRKTYHDFQKDKNLEEFDRMLDEYER